MRVHIFIKEDYENLDRIIEEIFKIYKPKLNCETIIKPNFVVSDNIWSITHPNFVKSVINVAKNYTEPILAEGGYTKNAADEIFDRYKFRELVKCINMNKEKFYRVHVGGSVLEDVKISETALRYAYKKPFISVPKMKVHTLTGVSLGIKNNIGFLKKPAITMHRKIHEKLRDLLKIFNPCLTIVDGIIGGENSELNSKPVKHGVIVASNNVIACDIVCGYLMGFFDQIPSKIDVISEKPLNYLRKKYKISPFGKIYGILKFDIRNLL